MSAILYNYLCAECGIEFQAAGVPEMSYGEFILRSDLGEEAFLEAINNETFDEVSDIVEAHPGFSGANPNRIADAVLAAFTAACDPSERGRPFYIGMKPTCPNCSSCEMASWRQVHPPKAVDIPLVTHTRWALLEPHEKKVAVTKAITDFF